MKNNESGRSMVEMLGVLAIIGVLSVGGIIGYSTAMKKYKVNQIIHAASMAAIMCATDRSVPSTENWGDSSIISSVGCNSTDSQMAEVTAADSALTADAATVLNNNNQGVASGTTSTLTYKLNNI